jgi:membrane-bound lytic murein transglycosylase MltF
MDFNSLTVGQIVALVTSVGIIFTVGYKIFQTINQVEINKKDIAKAHERIDFLVNHQKTEKEEIILKLEETNSAVNLLCSAISALIDNEITENGDIDALRRIKRKLDEKKEII